MPESNDFESASEKGLRRIRGLLAKAESTDFGEEAEALIAKAQELMSTYSIDEAMVGMATNGEGATARTMSIKAPYWKSKVSLAAHVATPNRCRIVARPDSETIVVIGYQLDIDNVELLLTSLLVQATSAMTQHGSSRSFRRSFLDGFARRIGERLQEAAERATHAEMATHGAALVPVLAGRDDEVRRVLEEEFPGATRMRHRVTQDRAGYAAGQASANNAQIGAHKRLK